MSTTKSFRVADAFTEPMRGKAGLSKAFIKDNPGEYPVFSATTTGPLGHIDSFNLEGPALSWTTNGYAGNVMVLDGQYSITSDRALVRPLLSGLNLDFCRLVLQAKFRDAARGRRVDGKNNEYTKLTADLVRDIEFEVPVGPEGALDEAAQAAFVARYARISAFQDRARDMTKLLASAVPKPSVHGAQIRRISLMDDESFRFVRKETSWGKKDWHHLSTGDENHYPVYSAAKGPVAYVAVETPKLIKASETFKVVSFAVDGDSSAGGNLVIHTQPFYISTNRASFVSLDPSIDMDYVFHSLSTMKADHGFDFSYKAYKAHLEDVAIEFPLDAEGNLDIEAQLESARRRSQLLKLRDETLVVLRRVATAKVLAESYAG